MLKKSDGNNNKQQQNRREPIPEWADKLMTRDLCNATHQHIEHDLSELKKDMKELLRRKNGG